MKGIKLIKLLKTLTDKELRWLERYIHSSFFNVNKEVKNLFFVLQKYHPLYANSKLTEEKAFSKIFPGHPFNKQKLKYVISDTTVLVENYLAFLQYNHHSFYKNYFLMEACYARQLDKYFTENLQKYNKVSLQNTQRDNTYYFHEYQINQLVYSHVGLKQNRSSHIELQKTADNLDVFYLSAKLKYCCEIINKQNVISADYQISMLDEILSHLNKKNYDHIPTIAIYYQILVGLLDSENESHYKKLIELLNKNSIYFKQDELRDMYAFAQNYCIKKINSGKTVYLREIYKLYQSLLEKEILIQNEILSQWDYKNIVVTAMRLGEFEWVENFIHEYKNKIREEDRENAFTFNLAYFHFYKKEYKKALRLLQSVEFTDIYYQLDSKALLLKIFYEAEDWDPLLSMTDSFKAFLKRTQSLSGYQNKAYSNFVISIQKLSKLKFENQGSVSALQEYLKNTTPLADTSWLNKSLDELMKK